MTIKFDHTYHKMLWGLIYEKVEKDHFSRTKLIEDIKSDVITDVDDSDDESFVLKKPYIHCCSACDYTSHCKDSFHFLMTSKMKREHCKANCPLTVLSENPCIYEDDEDGNFLDSDMPVPLLYRHQYCKTKTEQLEIIAAIRDSPIAEGVETI